MSSNAGAAFDAAKENIQVIERNLIEHKERRLKELEESSGSEEGSSDEEEGTESEGEGQTGPVRPEREPFTAQIGRRHK